MPEPKKTAISVDFTGVESGGGRGSHIPEGDYGFRVSRVVFKKKEDDPKGPGYLSFMMEVIKPVNSPSLKKKVYHTCSLKKNSLWNLRNLLEACGKQVPSKAVKLSLENLKNLECAGTVVDDEYEGKPKSVISAFFPMADLFIPNADKKKDEEAGEEEEGETEGETEETEEGEEAEETEESEEGEELFE